jgi:CheY-like chemotaxis protein
MASDSNPGPLKELATSRARFIAELGERLASIRHGLARVGATPEASGELNAVRRRLHALAASADVLHFTAAADALRRAELELASLAGAPSAAPARERVARVLDLVSSLALGAAIDVGDELEGEHTRSAREPVCVLVFGEPALEAALHKPGPLHGAETYATRELDQLLTLVTRLGPDVLLLDGDDAELVEFLPRLRQAAGSHPFPWVAVGNFESYEGMLRLVRRGISRVLPKPIDPMSLQRTLRLLVPRELASPPRPNPFERMGPNGLIDVISGEARRAFVDPHSGAVHAPALSADAGNQALAALWSAFARIRLLAAHASEAGTRFTLEGPHGMIPLAPALAEARSATGHDSTVGEALAGRRFVVADADPTLLGALSRTLQRLGASVLPARDGAQALELCERQWPDALICDALLPNLDGFELCRRVRGDVALGDLPVALICWKEHLLELARRLSEQHQSDPRPLDPESFAPLAEALAKRMLLERRLERHDAVHGRIDGLTPRLLHAHLLDASTIVAEGPAALGPFLGMRAGRFSLEPLSTAPPAHFSGDVMTVLAQPIGRARRARAWLSDSGARGLSRVDLEPRVAALYQGEAPAAHKALLSRLTRGESPRQLLDPNDSTEAAEPPPLTALLLELVRRGGVVALIDESGHDVLEPDLARTSGPPRGRSSDAPAVVLPAALSLAEAVLQAVSAPTDSDKPSARRTHPGLAPPTPPPPPLERQSSTSRASTPPFPDPQLSEPPPASAPTSVRAVSTSAKTMPPTSTPAPPSARVVPVFETAPSAPVNVRAASPNAKTMPPASSRAAPEPREVREAWSSEPDTEGETESDARPASSDPVEANHTLNEQPRSRASARVRRVAGPVLVMLGAAALAFAGMTVLTGGALEGDGDGPSTRDLGNLPSDPPSAVPTHASASSVAPGSAVPPANPAPSAATLTPAEGASASAPVPAATTQPSPPDAGEPDGRTLAKAAGETPAPRTELPLDVDVTTEPLDAPLQAKLFPGHGLLEVRTWEPQRIYVDGVFVGNYASRLVPLGPGTYQVRLIAGAREIEQAVKVEAGKRTRVWARLESNE